MKRFHVHIAVNNLDQSIAFYSKLFGQAPSATRSDYAKWMLDDPRLNFAISARGLTPGLNHFGFQVDSADELGELKSLAMAAGGDEVLDQGATTCCYANSEKHWTLDPQGLAWEHFHTLSEAIEFGGNENPAAKTACCVPIPIAIKPSGGCC